MKLKNLEIVSHKYSAQKLLTNLRINIVGEDIDEFKAPSFVEALKRLQGLRVIELNPICHEADIFLCKRLGPYLLSLTELDHVPRITLAKRERRLLDHLQGGFRQLAVMLEQRNKDHLLPDPPRDSLFLLGEEIRSLIRFADTIPLHVTIPDS